MPSIAIGPRDEEEAAHADEEAREEVQETIEDEAEEEVPPAPPRTPHLRVLFSDVEGVLAPRPDPRILTVSKSQCVFLRRLLQRTGAQLVLTTAWRRHQAYVVEVLDNFGAFEGSASKQGVETTPFNADPSRRDLEILQWLNSHRGEVMSWAVLDTRDLLGFASAPRLQGHVIQVDAEKGLQPEHVDAAAAILGELQGSSDAPLPPAPSPAAQPQPASGSASLFAHVPMDEGLVSKMQSALALFSSLPQEGEPAFQPPQRSKELRCAPDTEFDAIALQAKHKFT